MPKYKTDDYVVHGRDICKVIEILPKYRLDKDYYKLQSLDDETLVTYSPVERQDKMLRSVISADEAELLIDRLRDIEVVEVDARTVESMYNSLAESGNHEDIIKLIKTTYRRCSDKLEKGQAKPEKDKMYFRMAEKMLYSEFAVALGRSYADTKQYVIERAQAASL